MLIWKLKLTPDLLSRYGAVSKDFICTVDNLSLLVYMTLETVPDGSFYEANR